ncbi:MAG UNVERIFIED_CONTAM: hypothetical protein LVT10_25490 [Anaerolineae bacterium]
MTNWRTGVQRVWRVFNLSSNHMLDQIGLLDDDFFFLLEDRLILGNWRAQLAGWRCLYTPHAMRVPVASLAGEAG